MQRIKALSFSELKGESCDSISKVHSEKEFKDQFSEYIINRNDKSDEIDSSYKWPWRSMLGGYTKHEKVLAGSKLLKYINSPSDVSPASLIPHLGALNQGDLKIYWQQFTELYPKLYDEIITAVSNELNFTHDDVKRNFKECIKKLTSKSTDEDVVKTHLKM